MPETPTATMPACPSCGHTMHRAGWVWSGHTKIQRYRCQGCGTTLQKQPAKEG